MLLIHKFKYLLVFAFCFVLSASSVSAQRASLVRVDAVKSEPLVQTVPVIGRLVALRSGNVAARIAGYVVSMKVRVGDRVKKGQVLALLNSDALTADLKLAQSDLVDAEADLKALKAQAELSRVELKRQKGLKKSVAFSEAKFVDARNRLAIALARVDRAKARIEIRKTRVVKAELNLAYASIKAPYNAVVVRDYTEEGSYLSTGGSVVELIDDRSLEITAEVPFNRISGLTDGREVSFRLDNGKTYTAKVRASLPSENSLTRTRTVRFTPMFKSEQRFLAQGQSVTLSIPAGEKRNILTVHKDGILKRGGADIVYVVENKRAQPRTITLGEGVDGRVEVLNGLKKGDLVVVRGNERLQPGSMVNIDKGAS